MLAVLRTLIQRSRTAAPNCPQNQFSNGIRASSFPAQVQKSDVQQIEQEFIVEHRRLAAAARQVDLDGLGGYSLRHQTLSQSCLEGFPDLEKPPRQRWEEPCAGVRRRQLEHRQRSLPLRLAAGLRSFTLRKRSRTASRRQSSAFSRQQIPYATQNGLAKAFGGPGRRRAWPRVGRPSLGLPRSSRPRKMKVDRALDSWTGHVPNFYIR